MDVCRHRELSPCRHPQFKLCRLVRDDTIRLGEGRMEVVDDFGDAIEIASLSSSP
jgi:hypothetical protein